MATAAALITDAQTRLGDPLGDRWSRPLLLGYLNYGLREYARRTKSFRRLIPLATGQWPERFELPTDTVEVYFVEYDGAVIQASSWRELEEYDSRFTTQQGTPERWYQDITDIGQMRLWPIPTDNSEDLATFEAAREGDVDSTGETGTAVQVEVDGTLATITGDEFGAIVSITDASGTRAFELIKEETPFRDLGTNGEAGSVSWCAASKLRIGYSYVPSDVAELTDIVLPDQLEEGLVFFLMVRAYEKDGETRDLEKAKYFRQMFEQTVFEATRRANDGFMARPRRVEGFWR